MIDSDFAESDLGHRQLQIGRDLLISTTGFAVSNVNGVVLSEHTRLGVDGIPRVRARQYGLSGALFVDLFETDSAGRLLKGVRHRSADISESRINQLGRGSDLTHEYAGKLLSRRFSKLHPAVLGPFRSNSFVLSFLCYRSPFVPSMRYAFLRWPRLRNCIFAGTLNDDFGGRLPFAPFIRWEPRLARHSKAGT
jgi:hypothetical protein